ncbi:MAG: hypothetical protein ACTMHL_12415 [Janibacter sp.]
MRDPRIERAAEVIRAEVGGIVFLGLDEGVRVAEALVEAGCLVDPGLAWEQGFEAGREMADKWGHAEWWTLAQEPANPYRSHDLDQ